MTRAPWVVGVSGASGTPYARAVLIGLLDAGQSVDLVVSRAARLTLLDETGLSFRDGHWRADLGEWLEPRPDHGRRGTIGRPATWAPDLPAVRTGPAG